MADDPAVTVRELYRLTNEKQYDRALELAAPDAQWVPDPKRVGVPPIQGRGAVIDFIRDRAEMFDEFSTEIEQLETAGDTVLAMVRVRGRGGASGAEFDIRIGHVWEIRDGLVVRGRGFGDRDEARRAAGL